MLIAHAPHVDHVGETSTISDMGLAFVDGKSSEGILYRYIPDEVANSRRSEPKKAVDPYNSMKPCMYEGYNRPMSDRQNISASEMTYNNPSSKPRRYCVRRMAR